MSSPTHDRCWTLKHLLGIISESDLRADQGSLRALRPTGGRFLADKNAAAWVAGDGPEVITLSR
jgi:hypothetical protein